MGECYEQSGLAGLMSNSRRRLGSRRIQSELDRTHGFEISRTTIDKILAESGTVPLLRPNRNRKSTTRYARQIPGERVQMDTCKIGPSRYQYTAINDCTHIRLLALYARRSAANTLLFLERVLEELPFPVQRIQTDRGREFFALVVQQRLMDYAIKFRPVKPASPHLNGKVERSQRTDLEEFYATTDLHAADLHEALLAWQDHYNHFRPHGSLNGMTPWEKWQESAKFTPCWDDIEALYDPTKERVRHPEYRVDLQLKNLPRK